MTLILVVGLAVVVSIVVAGATRRALVDERQSVRRYQQTLETLRSIGDHGAAPERPSANGDSRHASNGVRAQPATLGYSSASSRKTTKLASSSTRSRTRATPPVGAPPAEPGAPERRPPRRGSQPRTPERAEREQRTPLVFDDMGLATAPPRQPLGATAPVAPANAPRAIGELDEAAMASPAPGLPTGARGRPAGLRMSRAPRVSALAVIAAAVVVLGVALGIVLGSSSGHSRHATSHARTQKPPAHNIPVDNVLVATQSPSSFAATYRVPATSYVLQLTASGSCWVYATDSSGHVLWTGTMTAGQTRSVPAQGATVVKLGAASNISMSVSGRQVQLPQGFLSPFAATFTTS